MKAWKAVLAVLSATAIAASAQPGGPGGNAGGPQGRQGRGGGPNLATILENDQVVEKLGLTPEQVSALQARFAEAEKTMIKLRADSELAEAEVRQLMRGDDPDRAAVMKAVEAAGAAHTALRKAVIDERLAFRDIAGADVARKLRQHLGRQMKERRGQDGDRPFRKERRGPDSDAPPVEE